MSTVMIGLASSRRESCNLVGGAELFNHNQPIPVQLLSSSCPVLESRKFSSIAWLLICWVYIKCFVPDVRLFMLCCVCVLCADSQVFG